MDIYINRDIHKAPGNPMKKCASQIETIIYGTELSLFWPNSWDKPPELSYLTVLLIKQSLELAKQC